MSTIWQYQPEMDDPAEYIGFTVEARDGQVGTVDNASWDTDTDHLVVDTGPWIFGKKALIPAGLIETIDFDEEIVYLALDKDQIKDGPEYDPDRHQDPTPDYWTAYDDYYGGLPPMV